VVSAGHYFDGVQRHKRDRKPLDRALKLGSELPLRGLLGSVASPERLGRGPAAGTTDISNICNSCHGPGLSERRRNLEQPEITPSARTPWNPQPQ